MSLPEVRSVACEAAEIAQPRVWHATRTRGQVPQNPNLFSTSTMKPSYTQLATIDTPTDYVQSLAFSTNGRYLASSTNDNTLRVYDIEQNFVPIWEEKSDCPSTAIAWKDNALFTGSMDGTISCYYPVASWIFRQRPEVIYKTDDAVQALEFNVRGDYLLVCSGADVFLFEKSVVSGKWNYRDYLPRPSPFGEPNHGDFFPIVATGAHFLDQEDQCLIGYLYNGFWKFNMETWESTNCWGPDDSLELKDPRRYYGRIVASAKSPDSKSIVITDACLGLQWFKITSERLKYMSTTYHPQDLSSNIPLPVLFINQGRAVIVGSTKGCVSILETKRAERVQTLKHGNDQTWVTALAYVESTSRSRMIATGDGNRGQHTRIIVWTEDKKRSSLKFSNLWYIMHKITMHMFSIVQMALILAGIISTLSWLYPTLFPTLWREITKPRNPPAYTFSVNRWPMFPFSSSSTAIPTATPSSLVKRIGGLLNAFEELLGDVGKPID
ncbi:WD40-repeat-containing domain protein [Lentinula raphanica]|nr:WD40-repeat-containing domain protein [Lentinula raphanica]